MHYIFTFLFLISQLISITACAGQDVSKLHTQYQNIKQQNLDLPIIQPDNIYPLIEEIKNNDRFQVMKAGSSFLGRPIYKIQVGNGPLHIFMWSQMHGNEPTATGSLFDLVNYINAPENNGWFDSWKDKITLFMVPMVNPDGAQKKQRYNAQGVDINRDAKRLQTPEGKMLNALADEIKPEFGFNLHDQGRFNTVGKSGDTATISFLSPAFNDAKDMSEARHKAMQLIGLLNEIIQRYAPDHVGRYDDTYSFRAFGDLFSSKGIATTLIESGHYPMDPNRQMARWLTFMSLVQSIDIIVDQSFKKESLAKHDAIPMNNRQGLVDVLLKNVKIEDKYLVDLSINFDRYFQRAHITEIGDLTANLGLMSKDLSQYQFQPTRGFQLDKDLKLTTPIYMELLRQGFGYFVGDKSLIDIQTSLPVVINPKNITKNIPQRNQQPNFVFTQKGLVKLALINGALINVEKGSIAEAEYLE